jgi:putative component of toxin-antitoxin plasmid stabilization module
LVDPRQRNQARWVFYKSPAGKQVVAEEIQKVLGDRPKIELGHLMERIQTGAALPRDVRPLGRGLSEARLTLASNEYRLYFAVTPAGEKLLLALRFHQKGGQGAQDRNIDVARKCLAEWLSRI